MCLPAGPALGAAAGAAGGAAASSGAPSLGLLRDTGAGATKLGGGGGGGGIRNLTKGKTSGSAPGATHEGGDRDTVNKPFYDFLLSHSGSRRLRLLAGRALWRAAGRLSAHTHYSKR